jgi:hypothetical protein
MSSPPDDEALELGTAADARKLVLVAAQQEEPAELAAVRLEQDRLDALDLALLLQPRVILEDLVEHLGGLPLAPPNG